MPLKKASNRSPRPAAERVAGGPAGTGAEDALGAVAVVAGPALGVLQDLVGQADLLEPLAVAVVVLVGIGVELPGLGPVGPLELVVGGVAADPEDLVEIGVGHRLGLRRLIGPPRSAAAPSRSPTTRAAARASG